MQDFNKYVTGYDASVKPTPVYLVSKSDDLETISGLTAAHKKWLIAADFKAQSGSVEKLMDVDGGLAAIIAGKDDKDIWSLSPLSSKLTGGTFMLIGAKLTDEMLTGWLLGQYNFDRYKEKKATNNPKLMLPEGYIAAEAIASAEAIALVRDLVNTPTEDMGPFELQDITEGLAEDFGASCSTITGDDLLEENFPAIHAVGRAAHMGREPRLIDLQWGRADAPKVTLVGKGVCFDTGGLDLKPSQFMRHMKKDMGGAAHVLGLARLIMTTGPDVRLRVLVSAVENAVSSNAFRPGDILDTRKGLTVEVGNTDAEGRLVLCDALTLACEEKPDLLIDFATLTGAARVALGAELPATFTNDDATWTALEAASSKVSDPLWRLPLYDGYDSSLESDIADVSNISEGGYGGSITAALYLQRFIAADIKWIHLDVFAWNQKSRAGRPKGGEAQSLRAVFEMIKAQYTN